MGKTNAVLKVRSLVKRYGEKKAVDGVSFEVAKGECYALVGPNGAGKTTTIKLINGLLRIDSGKVTVGGYDIDSNPVKVKEMIGYIPDNPFSYPYLTGRQIIEYVSDLRGISRSKLDKKVSNLMKYYPLNGLINERFGDYSRGNKQKVMIMIAMISDPKLLLIDEPIVGLDVESQITTLKLLKEYMKDGGSILLSTHTLEFADKVASNVGIINEGNLIMDGKITDVKKKLKSEDADIANLYFRALGR